MPYMFRNRVAGESKLDRRVVWEYFMLLADKLVGRYVPVRFVSFALVGERGHRRAPRSCWLLFNGLGVGFPVSQAVATLVAIVFNFSLNNALTYRDRQLRGWRWMTGLVSFMLACGVGALANVGIASLSVRSRGDLGARGAGGIVVGAVWNYAVTAVYTWHKPARR